MSTPGQDSAASPSNVPTDVGRAGVEDGDAGLVPGLVVDDLDDLVQVEAIPPMPGMSFRGEGADWWEVGATYTEPGWLRTSRDPIVATANFRNDAAVALFGPCGRDVARLTEQSGEQETVFLPGSRFTVTRRGDLDGLWVTVVYVHRGDEQAPDAATISDEVMRAATVLGRARTLPPQPVARPERFTGPFGVRR